MTAIPTKQQQIRSTISSDGKLTLNLETIPVPEPADHEVLVRVEAAPINPSDLGLLIGFADIDTITVTGNSDKPEITMEFPQKFLKSVRLRLDKSMPCGNEGSGVVVAAGKNAANLIGKTVGLAGGEMYSQYRCIAAQNCLVMHEGTTPEQAASSFVNPLTALSMVETMRMENHKALIHTVGASNLGQMLIKICQADNVPLINIVRKEEQVNLVKNLGAEYVCNSSNENFMPQLIDAITATEATLAFDAIGGGNLASQILTAMEVSISQQAIEYSRYGSNVMKQVYIYGGLDRSPTVLNRSYGLTWSVSGWLLTPFIGRMGPERFAQLRKRVADEIKTTFASHYTKEVSLAAALSEDAIKAYSKQATGEKYLIRPQL